ncbi:hypothetical protein NA56DRAFT_222228 [Hyaloscypha hepaticicola]|uniref:Uncharacterized protein n=1 Tax=Hyaloscypha hepaticicola TaxID=2082293 RepID=A0A2J6PY10_9HELO|nr:hypothetical protein NA56DRAFT_222228 [Hyaloscypha hepaticicola]
MNLEESLQRRGMSRDDSYSRPKQSFLLQAFESSTASPVTFNLVIATHKAFGFSAASSNVGLSSPFVLKALPQGNSAIPSAHVKYTSTYFPSYLPYPTPVASPDLGFLVMVMASLTPPTTGEQPSFTALRRPAS